MVGLDDTVGAFVPGPRMERQPLGSGRLSGLGFAVKDLFDVAGSITTYGNPDWASTHGIASATAPVVTALLQAGARLAGKTKTVGTRLRPHRRERLAGHPGQSARAGPVPRRLKLRLGRRGRRGAGRLRTRFGYRRIGAHPGKLLRPVRHSSDPWRGQPRGRMPTGAELRHLRLVRPERGFIGGRRRGAAAWRPSGGRRPAAAGRGGMGQRSAGSGRSPAPGAGAARAVAGQVGRHSTGPRGDRLHLRSLPDGAGGGGLGLSRRLGRDGEAALWSRHRRAVCRRQGHRCRGCRTWPSLSARVAGARPAAAGRRRRAGLSDQSLPRTAAHGQLGRAGRRPAGDHGRHGNRRVLRTAGGDIAGRFRERCAGGNLAGRRPRLRPRTAGVCVRRGGCAWTRWSERKR